MDCWPIWKNHIKQMPWRFISVREPSRWMSGMTGYMSMNVMHREVSMFRLFTAGECGLPFIQPGVYPLIAVCICAFSVWHIRSCMMKRRSPARPSFVYSSDSHCSYFFTGILIFIPGRIFVDVKPLNFIISLSLTPGYFLAMR